MDETPVAGNRDFCTTDTTEVWNMETGGTTPGYALTCDIEKGQKLPIISSLYELLVGHGHKTDTLGHFWDDGQV